jgi:hypothetical protein
VDDRLAGDGNTIAFAENILSLAENHNQAAALRSPLAKAPNGSATARKIKRLPILQVKL